TGPAWCHVPSPMDEATSQAQSVGRQGGPLPLGRGTVGGILFGSAVIQDLGPFSAAAHHAAGARRQNRDLRAISASLFNYCKAVVSGVSPDFSALPAKGQLHL